MVCLIGFVISFIAMFFTQAEWVNTLMGISVSAGVFNGFGLASFDSRWREDYQDRSYESDIMNF